MDRQVASRPSFRGAVSNLEFTGLKAASLPYGVPNQEIGSKNKAKAACWI